MKSFHQSSEAKIGAETTIAPFAYIENDVGIGEACVIGPHACIWPGARIGNNVKIYAGAQISCDPQDMKYAGEQTITIIGNHTTVREHVTISRGTSASNQTIIGSHCLLMAYVHVAHDCIIGDHCIISNAVQIAGHVEMGKHVVIGGMSAIRQFVSIGSHAMITGGSLVRKDVPPFITAGREPLSYIGVNAIGLKRRGFSQEKINEIQEIYRIIFLSELNTTDAIRKITREFVQSAERDEIISFVGKSKLGIIKGFE